MAALAIQFWTGSRYPQLNEKALMGGDATLESPMSFEAVVVIQDGDSLIRKILLTTVNWADENRKGMTFGILFGAAFLTFFRLFQRRGSNSGFINTLMGVGAGAPLGVCVNCAAPIAKGLHDSGARLETTLSAMFSSPTLNIIILTMLLSIFPIYLSAVKIGFTLLFILVFVPVLCRTVFKQERTLTYNDGVCPLPPAALPPA